VDGVRHPDHDAVSQELHRWYNSAVPEIGLDGTAHWFGFTCMTGPGRALGFTDEVYWYSRYELSR
jgi:hypothetical protein